MNFRRALKRSETVTGLVRDCRNVALLQTRMRGRRMIRDYLASTPIGKLQIGCGSSMLEGWLNTDLAPECSSIAHLDATRPFPIGDGSFDYLFSEHMIEHVTWRQGLFVLNNFGHQFLYDGDLLQMAMGRAGLEDIRRCAIGESDDPNLGGIEGHGQDAIDKKMVEFETMVFEPRRPR